MEIIISMFLCSVAGLAAGLVSRLWIRALYEKRGLSFEDNKKEKILYPIAMTLAGTLIGYLAKDIVSAGFCLLLLLICGTVFMTDWTYRVIPNPTVIAVLLLKLLVLAAAALGARNLPEPRFLPSLLGFVICFVVFSLPGFFGRKVGAGDVKLAAAVGFLLGTYGALISIVLMGILIILYFVLQRKFSLITFLKTNIPMGPFIALGTVMTCLIMPMMQI